MGRHRIIPSKRDWNDEARSADVVEGIVDGTLLGTALMLFKIGLQLGLGLFGVGDQFPSRPKC
jgi:hypothetical protein